MNTETGTGTGTGTPLFLPGRSSVPPPVEIPAILACIAEYPEQTSALADTAEVFPSITRCLFILSLDAVRAGRGELPPYLAVQVLGGNDMIPSAQGSNTDRSRLVEELELESRERRSIVFVFSDAEPSGWGCKFPPGNDVGGQLDP